MVNNYKINKTNYCDVCPECNESWDSNVFRDGEKISKLLFIEVSDGESFDNGCNGFNQCPKCQISWDIDTGVRSELYKVMLNEDSAMKDFIAKLISTNKII